MRIVPALPLVCGQQLRREPVPKSSGALKQRSSLRLRKGRRFAC